MQVLTEIQIRDVLDRFYETVRADAELGPVFAVVEDWEEHMARLAEFWSSLMLASGKYKGNPLSMHLVHADRIKPAMFIRWLNLWKQATDDLLAPTQATEMQAKAVRVASRLSRAICGMPLPSQSTRSDQVTPYRTSPAFDQDTLPKALLTEHSLRAGTWGVVRVLDGSIGYRRPVGETKILTPSDAGLILPDEKHHLELTGTVRLQIEFYDRLPVEALTSNKERKNINA